MTSTTALQPPTFSVVIPAYNAAAFIEPCLDSVLAQTNPDFEVLVVDDGSTDDTAARIAEYVAKDPRVQLLQRPNGGLAAARNTGIRAARGEWVAFLDADDCWCPEKLAAHRQGLAADPTLSVTYDCAVFIDPAGQRTGLQMAETQQPLTPDLLLLKNYLGNGSTSVVRRSVLEAQAGFDESLKRMVDHELWIRLVCQGHRFGRIPGILTEYRTHPHSFTADTQRMLQGVEAFLATVSAYAQPNVERLRPLVLACTHRWMGRAAFMAGDYPTARNHVVQAWQHSPQVIWRDPRAPITFLAVLLQTLTPDPIFKWVRQWGLAGAKQWFSLRHQTRIPG